jgi:hypothetical protein
VTFGSLSAVVRRRPEPPLLYPSSRHRTAAAVLAGRYAAARVPGGSTPAASADDKAGPGDATGGNSAVNVFIGGLGDRRRAAEDFDRGDIW